MAFADWEIFATNLPGIALSISPVIAGVSSLRIEGAGFLASYGNMLPVVSGPYDVGNFTVGKLRTLIQPVFLAGSLWHMGLCAMQSARDLRTAGADFYLAYVTAGVVGLARCLNSLTGGLTVSLGTWAYTMVVGTPFALELEWIYSPDELQGVGLTVRHGTSYATLVDRIQVLDLLSAGALATSVGQGIGYYQSSTHVNHFRLDTTQFFGPSA